MFTYKFLVGSVWAILKDGIAYHSVYSETHAKMFCDNLNK